MNKRTQPLTRTVALGLLLSFFVIGVAARAEAPTPAPAQFVHMLREIAETGDLRRYTEVERILGVQFKRETSGKGQILRPDPRPAWISTSWYYLLDDRSVVGTRQNIKITLERSKLCITAQDVWSVLGRNYETFSAPPPHFPNKEEAEAFRREVAEGPNIYGMAYSIGAPSASKALFFFLRLKCLDSAVVETTPAPASE
jgi:hypothetical protein